MFNHYCIFILKAIKARVHWRHLGNIALSPSLLALATLGSATRIGSCLFLVTSPEVAKASIVMSQQNYSMLLALTLWP
jgi:hypothetical protein